MFYRRFMQAITIGSGSHTPAIDRGCYANSMFVAAFDLESAPDVQHSGVNTNSQSLSVFFEGIYSEDLERPGRVLITSHSDTLMEVTKRGVILGV